MVKKSHKLNISIDENYCVLGIASDEPDFKLCWLINQNLSANFVRIENIELFYSRSDDKQSFAIFQHFDEATLLTYRIIRNRSDNGYFLEEFKALDYVVHIQGDILQDEISSFIKKVTAIPSVRLCVPVELSKVRNRIRLELW